MASRHFVRRQLATVASSCAAGRSTFARQCYYSSAATSNLADSVKKSINVRLQL